MNEIREQQIEALEAMIDYSKKLTPALEEIITELKGETKEDTKEYLDYILKGLNWFIQVVNGTKSVLDEAGEAFEKDEVNGAVINLNNALEKEDNLELSEILENRFLPFVLNVTKIAEKLV